MVKPPDVQGEDEQSFEDSSDVDELRAKLLMGNLEQADPFSMMGMNDVLDEFKPKARKNAGFDF